VCLCANLLWSDLDSVGVAYPDQFAVIGRTQFSHGARAQENVGALEVAVGSTVSGAASIHGHTH